MSWAPASQNEHGLLLCLNSGSSSLKAAVFQRAESGAPQRVFDLAVDGIGEEDGALEWRLDGSKPTREAGRFTNHGGALAAMFEVLERKDVREPVAVGHRVVRSPTAHAEPAVLDAGLVADLEAIAPVAPLHIPPQLAAVRAAREQFPSALQIACFDNAFFRGLPAVSRRLPLPRELGAEGVERIGYHGLSYEFIVSATHIPRRAVIAHLGNGASMAALKDGRPIDTTMGFTPAGGLMMGTRSGDLDPGVLIEVVRRRGLDADGLEDLVNLRCGLAGISGGEADMETLLEAADEDPAARQAVESFCYIARKHLGAMIAALGGIDLLVFTGGIGQHAPAVRRGIVEGLEDLGLRLDRDANESGAGEIEARDSRARIRIVPTDEDLVIARHVDRLLAAREAKGSRT